MALGGSYGDAVRGIAVQQAPARFDGIDSPTGVDPAFASASAMISAFLRSTGLESELGWATGVLRQNLSPDEVLLQLRERPAYKTRFAANEERRKAGLPQLSEGEILSYERTVAQMMRAAGLPTGFYDQPGDFVNFLARDVSVSELQTRIQDGYAAATSAPAETRDELHRLYGVDLGGLAAYFLDPDRALPVLQRQFASAQIGGASQRSGFGALDVTEAERLAALGVSGNAAQEGFGTLVTERELFGALPGEAAAAIGRDQQLGATFGGDTAGADAIRRRSRSRAAVFGGGGSFASGQGGVSGLGSAESA